MTPESPVTEKRSADLAWQLFVELRKELVESQKLRSQIIGFKITFVSTGIGVIVTRLGDLSPTLFVVPAFAAIFFDFLVVSYSFSIKRLGFYCHHHLEPILRSGFNVPESTPLWQEFLEQPRTRQIFSIIGNVGLSLIAVAAGGIGVLQSSSVLLKVPLLSLLIALLLVVIWAYLVPTRFRDPTAIETDGK